MPFTKARRGDLVHDPHRHKQGLSPHGKIIRVEYDEELIHVRYMADATQKWESEDVEYSFDEINEQTVRREVSYGRGNLFEFIV